MAASPAPVIARGRPATLVQHIRRFPLWRQRRPPAAIIAARMSAMMPHLPPRRTQNMNIDHLDHLVLTVADIARTCEFYTRVLGMEVVTFGEGRTALRF